jgi:hypothetical protein
MPSAQRRTRMRTSTDGAGFVTTVIFDDTGLPWRESTVCLDRLSRTAHFRLGVARPSARSRPVSVVREPAAKAAAGAGADRQTVPRPSCGPDTTTRAVGTTLGALMRHRRWFDGARLVCVGGAVTLGVALVRARCLRWGATDAELNVGLPGDELLGAADLTATRAVTVRAGADVVWPWIAQLGQGRGGFYSYDFLENLVGCDIHSAERVVAEWQSIGVGDAVHLHPEVRLLVVVLEPGRALVLRGGVPIGRTPSPYDFTWAFVLREQSDGSTRLVVRERYRYSRRWAWLLVEPVELISFVMSRRMLRGIAARAQRAARSAPTVTLSPATPTTRRPAADRS